MEVAPRPGLKIVGLHIRSLGPLRELDLPADGVAWEEVPDLLLIGGANGSGKTTLLEFIAAAFQYMLADRSGLTGWTKFASGEAWIDVRAAAPAMASTTIRMLWGDQDFVDANAREPWVALVRSAAERDRYEWRSSRLGHAPQLDQLLRRFAAFDEVPGLLVLPTGDWTITRGGDSERMVGPLPERRQFVHRWREPGHFRESTEGLFYALRWADLNALAAGQKASHFSSYAQAFERFFGGTRKLRWTPEGKLVVDAEGVTHGLTALSHGERRVITLVAELHYWWVPGSLVLIDEPELHLHTRWQLEFWRLLRDLQAERGGQVIVATQSGDLFEVSDHRSVLLLGSGLR